MTFTASDATPLGAEWPPGVYWSPGETRTLPEGYPVPSGGGDAPAWLVPFEEPVAEVAARPARARRGG